MVGSYINNLMASFYLWLDHEVLSRGQAFKNYSGKLYYNQDRDYARSTVYTSPFKQWVSDSSINGAIIPSGVYVNGNFVPRGSSGLALDFWEGRVLFNTGVPNNITNITGQYAIKDFNLYYTDEREEHLMFEKRYVLNAKTPRITGGINTDDFPFPCIFIKNRTLENKPFAFGGQDQTLSNIRCIVLADTIYKLDSVISIMADSAKKVFPIVPQQQLPFNISGDYKYGNNYNYPALASAVSSGSNLVYIDRVSVSKLEEFTNKHMSTKVVAALVDFDVWSARFTRVYS